MVVRADFCTWHIALTHEFVLQHAGQRTSHNSNVLQKSTGYLSSNKWERTAEICEIDVINEDVFKEGV